MSIKKMQIQTNLIKKKLHDLLTILGSLQQGDGFARLMDKGETA